MLPFFVREARFSGAVAKRLCPGLQIRLVRFDSGPRLQNTIGSGQCIKVLRGLFRRFDSVESEKCFLKISLDSPEEQKMAL